MTCPTGKFAYRTRGAARRNLRNLRARGRSEVAPYPCPHCLAWHLTSHPRSSR
ncbi:hypothetical protein ACFVHW_31805 [Streptomyces sp. NPDC127110]|uniref:hypothetical protein n=1 Tax=Streptomyces sp. NPDC127110 TaxID=3345362 RepID=UPI00362C4ABA